MANSICELFKLCSTKQLETAKHFISTFNKSSHEKKSNDKSTDHDQDKKSSVTIAMEQLSVSDKSLTINDHHCSVGHHGNSEGSTVALGMDDDSLRSRVVMSEELCEEDDGWEVVKRKKR